MGNRKERKSIDNTDEFDELFEILSRKEELVPSLPRLIGSSH
jgi:hypothetical protein